MILEKHESRASQEIGKAVAQSESAAPKSIYRERVMRVEKQDVRASHLW